MPASTARARRCGSASCSGTIGFGSRFGTGGSDLTRRRCRRTVSAWRASGNGRGCWAASAASEASPARAPASPSSCRWWRGNRRGRSSTGLLPAEPTACARSRGPRIGGNDGPAIRHTRGIAAEEILGGLRIGQSRHAVQRLGQDRPPRLGSVAVAGDEMHQSLPHQSLGQRLGVGPKRARQLPAVTWRRHPAATSGRSNSSARGSPRYARDARGFPPCRRRAGRPTTARSAGTPHAATPTERAAAGRPR